MWFLSLCESNSKFLLPDSKITQNKIAAIYGITSEESFDCAAETDRNDEASLGLFGGGEKVVRG